jgi:hypothetical protein
MLRLPFIGGAFEQLACVEGGVGTDQCDKVNHREHGRTFRASAPTPVLIDYLNP